MKHILQLKSDIGNTYFYDQRINMFLPIEEYKDSYHELILKQYKLPPSSLLSPTQQQIKKRILSFGLNELTLGITERCNLRCNYCVYSNNYYPGRRPHSSTDMDFAIAKKAIDNYMNLVIQGYQDYNPYRRPVIGFYGGEPLLKFDLIKSCLEYVKAEYQSLNPYYTITTNGTLLTENRVKFLLNNGFESILISLDGPESEHNRNRVFQDGEGSFKRIMDNIELLPAKYTDQLYTIATYDWKTDFNACDNFFRSLETLEPLHVNAVDQDGGYYTQFSSEDFNNFKANIARAKTTYRKRLAGRSNNKQKSPTKKVEEPQFGYLDSWLLKSSIVSFLGQGRNFRGKAFFPFTGACIPGSKLYVDVEGRYHLCEKIPDSFPTIGNVNKGLDYSAIEKIIRQYQSVISTECEECPIRHLCQSCETKHINRDSDSEQFESCDKQKRISGVCEDLGYSLSLFEEIPELPGNLTKWFQKMNEQIVKWCP